MALPHLPTLLLLLLPPLFPQVSTRQGVCLGIKEVLENMGRQQLAEHMADMLPTVQVGGREWGEAGRVGGWAFVAEPQLGART
jgi:hypothetical protein